MRSDGGGETGRGDAGKKHNFLMTVVSRQGAETQRKTKRAFSVAACKMPPYEKRITKTVCLSPRREGAKKVKSLFRVAGCKTPPYED